MPYSKEQRAIRDRQRWLEHREIARKAKERPCKDCGVQYPYWVMQFDHVRGEKLKDVSQLTRVSKTKLYEELEKCEVVCSNCHATRTYHRKKWLRK